MSFIEALTSCAEALKFFAILLMVIILGFTGVAILGIIGLYCVGNILSALRDFATMLGLVDNEKEIENVDKDSNKHEDKVPTGSVFVSSQDQSKIKEYEDKLKHLDKGAVYLIKAKMNEQSPQPINYSYGEIEKALRQYYNKKINEYKEVE